MSVQHISDDLPRLLTGDASRDVVLHAATHLRTCVDCQQELVSAVIAHASLTSAHRFAPEIVSPATDDADLEDDAPLAEVTPLPDLSGLFAEARAEKSPAPVTHLRTRRRLAAVVAAAAVVAGGGITYAAVSGGDDGPATRTVALEPFGIGDDPAKVTIVGDSKIQVDASKLPKLGKERIYEVWLTDSQRKKMQSVGFIDDSNKAELSVSPKWMSQYNDIEVSVQKVNQDEYSGVSVLRGSYG